MWIFLNNAFLSIVAHRDKPNVLLVRARAKPDITRVWPSAKVKETKIADYRYRTELTRDRVQVAIGAAIGSIDYPNFKNSVPDDERHQAYMAVWTQMHRYQSGFFKPRRAGTTIHKPRE